MEEYVTLREAGRRLGLSFAQLVALVDRGELAAYRLNEVRPDRPERTVVRLLRREVEAMARKD